MARHHPEVVKLAEEILERAGIAVVSEETAEVMRLIEAKHRAGMPISQATLEAVLYAVAVALGETKQFELA